MEIIKAKEPFKFYTRHSLSELTGLKAANLEQILKCLEQVPGSSIYHHMHRALQQHLHLSPEPPNDFAYWVSAVLGEHGLGEKLASINTVELTSIRAVREKLINTITSYMDSYPMAKHRFAMEGEELYFVKSITFILPTNYVCSNLVEFAEILEKITIDSVYFHVFEARLRLEKGCNDFSNWIDFSVGDKELADKISKLDPYSYTMENLRKRIFGLVKERIAS